jgi:hypothetical protein
MNYLTNYYKNLSEQLQDKLNYLENILNESADKSPKIEMKDGLLNDVNLSEITPKTIHTIHPDHLEYHLNMLNNILDDSDGGADKDEQAKANMISAYLEKKNHFS